MSIFAIKPHTPHTSPNNPFNAVCNLLTYGLSHGFPGEKTDHPFNGAIQRNLSEEYRRNKFIWRGEGERGEGCVSVHHKYGKTILQYINEYIHYECVSARYEYKYSPK